MELNVEMAEQLRALAARISVATSATSDKSAAIAVAGLVRRLQEEARAWDCARCEAAAWQVSEQEKELMPGFVMCMKYILAAPLVWCSQREGGQSGGTAPVGGILPRGEVEQPQPVARQRG